MLSGRDDELEDRNGTKRVERAGLVKSSSQLIALAFPFSLEHPTSSPIPPPIEKRNMLRGSHCRLIRSSLAQFSGPNVLATLDTGVFSLMNCCAAEGRDEDGQDRERRGR
jgi:hypothetical protein